MKWVIFLAILFIFTLSASAQSNYGISKTNDCSLSNAIKVQTINQRDVENNTHNYWATREIDFRLTNLSKCPIFIKIFETLGSSDLLPVGFALRFDEKKRQWSHNHWENKIPKLEEFGLSGFDNYLLNPKQSLTVTDLQESVPYELLKTFPFKIKYKRIFYISFDKSAAEVKAIESPVFIITNLK